MRAALRCGCPTASTLLAVLALATCSNAGPSGDSPAGGVGSARAGTTGGAGRGDAGPTGGTSGSGSPSEADARSGGGTDDATTDAAPAPGADAASGGHDASGPMGDDANGAVPGASDGDGGTPMGSDGGPQPSYEGEIPLYDGAEVGPLVKMQCPDDPTQGWTAYQDSFHVERPYMVPINKRFSIIGGIYDLWVFPNDGPHSPIAHGRGPRTEATYGGLHDKANLITDNSVSNGIAYFTSGTRMYSADLLLDDSSVGSIVVQIHTTAAGIGPIYMGFTGGNLLHNNKVAVTGSSVPGGLTNTWFNLKVAFDAATLKSQLYVNNCLKATVSGPRGDGHFYFKNGVYGCRHTEGCHERVKNVRFYTK